MSVVYVQFSDIHFGQEKGGRVFTHDDVRERVIDDVSSVIRNLPNRRANGIIVSGDVAYAGKEEEYKRAGKWLDQVALAAGCEPTDVQVVPGNHDIDRNGICGGSELMLCKIAVEGETCLDGFLENETDRELLYHRFPAYRAFAEGYDCPLDGAGGAAGHKVTELAPGRSVRFVGLNSALCCSVTDVAGTLLLGARQRILPRTPGEEIIVLCHHPLHWLRDSDETRNYVRSRARVFISGHEHSPRIHIDEVSQGCEILMIASGATVPPVADARFTYTYNILDFDWDSGSDSLKVSVHPRIWSASATAFESNEKAFDERVLVCTLGSPNFRSSTRQPDMVEPTITNSGEAKATDGQMRPPDVSRGSYEMPELFSYLLLRFFRDLTAAQRLSVLVKLGALPESWNGQLTHSMERKVLNGLKASDKLDELKNEIESILTDGDANG